MMKKIMKLTLCMLLIKAASLESAHGEGHEEVATTSDVLAQAKQDQAAQEEAERIAANQADPNIINDYFSQPDHSADTSKLQRQNQSPLTPQKPISFNKLFTSDQPEASAQEEGEGNQQEQTTSPKVDSQSFEERQEEVQNSVPVVKKSWSEWFRSFFDFSNYSFSGMFSKEASVDEQQQKFFSSKIDTQFTSKSNSDELIDEAIKTEAQMKNFVKSLGQWRNRKALSATKGATDFAQNLYDEAMAKLNSNQKELLETISQKKDLSEETKTSTKESINNKLTALKESLDQEWTSTHLDAMYKMSKAKSTTKWKSIEYQISSITTTDQLDQLSTTVDSFATTHKQPKDQGFIKYVQNEIIRAKDIIAKAQEKAELAKQAAIQKAQNDKKMQTDGAQAVDFLIRSTQKYKQQSITDG